MRPRARTPDELDALLEDAFVVRDRRALAALFERDALLVDACAHQARGATEIARWATATWKRGLTYVAAEPRVLRAGDTALALTPDGITVARRHTTVRGAMRSRSCRSTTQPQRRSNDGRSDIHRSVETHRRQKR
jgi:ketosteroid isomerase-like protein